MAELVDALDLGSSIARCGGGDEARAAQSYAAAVAYPDAPADAWRWHGIALMKAGRMAEARQAFARYLTMKPDAPDAAWVRQMAG